VNILNVKKTKRSKYYVACIFMLVFSQPFIIQAQPSKRSNTEINTYDTLKIGVALTTQHLMELVTPAFCKVNAGINITSKVDQTGNVVADVMDGRASVAVTTRNLKDYEKEKSATIMGNPIGLDGLVLVVSSSIPVTSLTFDQINAIWTGTLVNWKELGGPDLPITVIGRAKAYDPIMLFCDFMALDSKPVERGIIYSLKGKDLWSKTVATSTANDSLALDILSKIPGTITYLPLQVFYDYRTKGYMVKALDFNGVPATPTTIENGEYFIHRRLNIITNGEPKGATQTFVDFVLSNEGQQLVKEAGFLPLNK
jgi:phosphate transport system substrate-binding protein